MMRHFELTRFEDAGLESAGSGAASRPSPGCLRRRGLSSRCDLQGPALVPHRSEVHGARAAAAGSLASPAAHRGLGPPVSRCADLRGPCRSQLDIDEDAVGFDPSWPWSCSRTRSPPSPALPEGPAGDPPSGLLGPKTGPSLGASHQRDIRGCRAPGGAASEPVASLCRSRVKPETWSGVAVILRKAGHRRLVAAPTHRRTESPPKEVVPDPAGSCGWLSEESRAKSLAGLLS